MTQFAQHRTMSLTDSVVINLPRPKEGRQTIRDSKVPHLLLVVGPRSRTFYMHATARGRSYRVNLGRAPVLSVDDARRAAVDALRDVWAGVDPRISRTAAVPTLREALQAYLGRGTMRPASVRDCRGTLERHAAPWLDRVATSVDPAGLAAAYKGLSTRSPATAAKLLRHLGAVLRHAAAACPAIDPEVVTRARALAGGAVAVAPRDRLIPDALQGAWFAALQGEAEPVRRLLCALALTGCRREELRDLPAAAWSPAADSFTIGQTKTGRPHTLPVTPALVWALGDSLPEVSESTLRGAYERIGRAIGQEWSPHDLRRGFASIAARLGVDELQIKRLLNHAATGVTQRHYVRLGADDVRGALERVQAHLLGLWGVTA
ncbi:MAG: integrase family protein [Burkholderiaceae bacterium]|nr:integrase family protein [Burkholderiaceae bacterium]